jgi:hypothetical protein
VTLLLHFCLARICPGGADDASAPRRHFRSGGGRSPGIYDLNAGAVEVRQGTLRRHIDVKVKQATEDYMRIGALSRQTGVSRRLLRYYEEQGLLRPVRLANGYREYSETDVAAVQHIRALLAAGLPTAVIAGCWTVSTTTVSSSYRPPVRA